MTDTHQYTTDAHRWQAVTARDQLAAQMTVEQIVEAEEKGMRLPAYP